ncbi:MAG TPA: MFS transporter [Anaeromyxobacteraceae bacterium]|nr:MFS transporter [Anaeromyxobacteraceae bacterium]
MHDGGSEGPCRSRLETPPAGFLALTALAGLNNGLSRVTASLHAVALGASAAQLGLLAATPGLGLMLVSVPGGAFVRRHGLRRTFVTGSVLSGLAFTLVPALRTPAFLIACTAIGGMGMSLRYLVTNLVVMGVVERSGSDRAGWFRGSNQLTMMLIAPAVAVPLVAAAGFSLAWWLIAGTCLLAAIAAACVFGDGAPRAPARDAWAVLSLGRDRRLLGLASVEALTQATLGYFSYFIIPIAVKVHGMPATAAGALLSTQAAGFILALFALGGVARWLERGRFAALAYGAVALALGLLGASRSAGGLWAGSVLLGLALGLVHLDNLIRSARLGADAGREAVAGSLALSGALGGLAGGVCGGLAAGSIGLAGFFLVLASLFAGMGWRRLRDARGGGAEARPRDPELPHPRPERVRVHVEQ